MSALEQLYQAGLIPKFLDRTIKADGSHMTREDIDVLRSRLNKAYGTLKIKSPKLHKPRYRRAANGLGVPVSAIKKMKGA